MEPITEITKAVPFTGGAVTSVEPALLPLGQYSMVQNLRNRHPGLEKRTGTRKLHTTADGTNEVISLFQFAKGQKTESVFYAQMGDGDVLKATAEPPAVTTGVFGSEVFDGSASPKPAAWNIMGDKLLFSNSVDQHQIYLGTTYVRKFIKFLGTAAPPAIPTLGNDYTVEVTDGKTTTHAVLDSLGDLATDHDCIFIMTQVPINKLSWVVSKVNGTIATMNVKYRKTDFTWQAVASFSDGTSSDSKTLAQSGDMTWTLPTDSMPTYMYGTCGYWYQLYLSTGHSLDAEVEVTSVTFDSNWQDLENVWDGALRDAVEAQFFDQSDDVYFTSGSTAINVSNMIGSADDSKDRVYFATPYPIIGFYVDVGGTPNTNAAAINKVKYFNGAFADVSNLTDDTDGLSQSGWVTFGRQSDVEQTQFQATQYHAYWYYFTVSADIQEGTLIGITVMPYYDIDDFGKIGNCNGVWKNRAVYTFNEYPEYLYIAEEGNPQSLNGYDFMIQKVGDGRSNKIVNMKSFYNELIVFQEEKGEKGGCVTLVEGYSPTTIGNVNLSTDIGTMNAKSVAVVDNVALPRPEGQEAIGLAAFFLSRKGVYMTDGKIVYKISSNIGNYFDPKKSECIRRGYEDKMWLSHDSSEEILRIGLVSGSSATIPNIFLIYDIQDRVWSFDKYANNLSCFTEVSAGSGNTPTVCTGGGCADGTVYQMNYGTNDVATAIDSYVQPEFSGAGKRMNLNAVLLRIKAQSAGNITFTPTLNGIAQTALTLAQTAVVTSQTIRRHRKHQNLTSQHITLKFQHNTESQSAYFLDYAVGIDEYEEQ